MKRPAEGMNDSIFFHLLTRDTPEPERPRLSFFLPSFFFWCFESRAFIEN